jgi:hypothetical protein
MEKMDNKTLLGERSRQATRHVRWRFASRRPGQSRNWTTKGEDELHPRLVRGRFLENQHHTVTLGRRLF